MAEASHLCQRRIFSAISEGKSESDNTPAKNKK